jgi:hypothetical protein
MTVSTFFQHFAYGFAGLHKWCQIRTQMLVNRRGHGDDVTVACAQIINLRCLRKMRRCFELFTGCFQR